MNRNIVLARESLLPESELPLLPDLIDRGTTLAREIGVGPAPFLKHFGIESETDYKRQRVAQGAVMLHAQIGYRDLGKSRSAYAVIHDAVERAGGRVDRYGICLDWSMGFPREDRAKRPKGTGLILEQEDDFAALTAEAPVAPHFGDFVIGTPAALENTIAALRAGSTTIGNLGQYFTFRMPGWPDDIGPTARTVEALALCAAQPQEILIHSNLDDGFAALFCDLACSLGAVLIERHIVEDLLGGKIAHCFGHTFSDPLTRLAFQRALHRDDGIPGSMIYGNTVLYDGEGSANYAALSSYLLVDAVGQKLLPSGHAINPVPVTEAARIPDIEEVIDAQLVALRIIERAEEFRPAFDLAAADEIAQRLRAGAQRFKAAVLNGLAKAGIDAGNAFELLLALRRIGAKRLEEAFGPGAEAPEARRGRAPVVKATTISALERAAAKCLAHLSVEQQDAIANAKLTACVGASDVHEYGKILVEETLKALGVTLVDGGSHAEPADIAALAKEHAADLIAISTYNGIALHYLEEVLSSLDQEELQVPLFIGGKLNQIPEASNTSLPVDVSREIAKTGAVPCPAVEDLLDALVSYTKERNT